MIDDPANLDADEQVHLARRLTQLIEASETAGKQTGTVYRLVADMHRDYAGMVQTVVWKQLATGRNFDELRHQAERARGELS